MEAATETSEWICIKDCQDATGIIRKKDVVYHEGPIIPCVTCGGDGKGRNEGKDNYEGKPCRKCSGTGRGIPSHHFNPYDPVAERLARETQKVEDDAKVIKLREEITEAGGSFDHRWGAERLEAVLVTTLRLKGADKKETFKPYTDKAEATGKAIELGIKIDGRASLKGINEQIKAKLEE